MDSSTRSRGGRTVAGCVHVTGGFPPFQLRFTDGLGHYSLRRIQSESGSVIPLRKLRIVCSLWTSLAELPQFCFCFFTLSRPTRVCRDKCMLVATKLCLLRHIFVTTNVLSRQKYFVATKMILVVASANDMWTISVNRLHKHTHTTVDLSVDDTDH